MPQFRKRTGEGPLGLYICTTTQNNWGWSGGAILNGAVGGTDPFPVAGKHGFCEGTAQKSPPAAPTGIPGGTSPSASPPRTSLPSSHPPGQGAAGPSPDLGKSRDVQAMPKKAVSSSTCLRRRFLPFPASSPSRAETGPPHASPPPKYIKIRVLPCWSPSQGRGQGECWLPRWVFLVWGFFFGGEAHGALHKQPPALARAPGRALRPPPSSLRREHPTGTRIQWTFMEEREVHGTAGAALAAATAERPPAVQQQQRRRR